MPKSAKDKLNSKPLWLNDRHHWKLVAVDMDLS